MRLRVTCTYRYVLAASTDDKGILTLAHEESGGGQSRDLEADSVQAALDAMEHYMRDRFAATSVTFERVDFLPESGPNG